MEREAWTDARETIAPAFDGPFELRFSLDGAAAVRVAGAVAPRHAEPPEPTAPWWTTAACGTARGWLLAPAPPSAPVAEALLHAVEREAARRLAAIAGAWAEMGADLLERLTHRLRTDVSTLQAVAEGALLGVFDGDERGSVAAEIRRSGTEAQRRISLAREVMAALHPEAPRRPEPLLDVLAAELEAAGAPPAVRLEADERPMVRVPGGASAPARLLAAAVARDARLAGSVTVSADPEGWAVTAGAGNGPPVPWTEDAVGELAHAGQIAVAAGGSAVVRRADPRALRVRLTLPAAPSP